MTRFLPRIVGDPSCGNFNQETERLFAYHHATKHTYHSVRSGAHYLDWINQPSPFRTYEGAPSIPLPPQPGFSDAGTFATISALAEIGKVAESKPDGREHNLLDMEWLSRLMWHSMAVSAWKKAPMGGSRYSLRVNPSSGNLHPTETYLALRGFAGIGDGLYHYRADLHALELRSEGAMIEQLSQALKISWAAESQLIFGLTSIFWREAWKYRDRAYRYCCHDMGHAMMSLLLAARASGMPGGAVCHFGDASLTRALGLTGGDEAPFAFLVFPSKTSPPRSPARSPDPQSQAFLGIPNELSAEEVPYQLLLEMHRATILPDSVGPVPMPSLDAFIPALSPSRSGPDAPLREVVRRRRSALDFDPRTPPMRREELEQLLEYATRDWRADWRGNFNGLEMQNQIGVDFVTLYLYVHRVDGCEPGVYRWEKNGGCLTLLHRGDVRRIAAFLSLEQTLAGNSCFTISMIADLAAASGVFGNRGYRYAHFEAGAIGQRLYLGAETLHWNATGIGAFYDDDVHRYLGLLEEAEHPVGGSLEASERATLVALDSTAGQRAKAQGRDWMESPAQVGAGEADCIPGKDAETLPRQVIYHFAVGRAIPDPRVEG